MFRLFRQATTPLAYKSVAKQVRGSQVAVLQRVKLSRRPAKIRNVLIGGGAIFVCYQAYATFVIDPWLGWIERQMDSLSDEELNELDKLDKEPMFIPFPLTIKAVPREPYRGNDPEWKAFVKISQDKDLQTRIRKEMADTVRSVAGSNPVLIQKCGKDWKIRRWWMDVDYPYRPPPKYQRSGIEIGDHEVVWTSRDVDSTTALRIQRILWPSPMASSMFSFAGTLFRQNVFDAARYFGFQPSENHKFADGPNPAIKRTIERLQQQSTKDPQSIKDPRTLAKQEAPDGTPAISAETSPPATADGSPRTPSPKDFYPYDKVKANINSAWGEMRKSLSQKWKPLRELPPSGCILVSGLVELETNHAYVVIDVYSWWDPKTRKYDTKSMWMGLRRLQMKKQAPALR